MVESSAAALKILPSLQKCLIFWTNLDTKGGGDIGVGWGGFMSLFSENRKQGNFVQPFRTTLLSQLQFLPVWTVESVESGWHYQFCLTRDLQKTCCSELSSSLVTGELLGYPSDIRWPFTHRGTIVYLFSRFLN